MPDREKVIKGWETVLSRDPLDAPWDLIDETLTLLKEQDAIIEQLKRFVNGFSREAVPVVRCKDCKEGVERYKGDAMLCNKNGRYHGMDWFCADGKRIET